MLSVLLFIIKIVFAVIVTYAIVNLLLEIVLSTIYFILNGLGRVKKARR